MATHKKPVAGIVLNNYNTNDKQDIIDRTLSQQCVVHVMRNVCGVDVAHVYKPETRLSDYWDRMSITTTSGIGSVHSVDPPLIHTISQ